MIDPRIESWHAVWDKLSSHFRNHKPGLIDMANTGKNCALAAIQKLIDDNKEKDEIIITLRARLARANDRASRLQYPDTTGN
jgi:hypothetical protein